MARSIPPPKRTPLALALGIGAHCSALLNLAADCPPDALYAVGATGPGTFVSVPLALAAVGLVGLLYPRVPRGPGKPGSSGAAFRAASSISSSGWSRATGARTTKNYRRRLRTEPRYEGLANFGAPVQHDGITPDT